MALIVIGVQKSLSPCAQVSLSFQGVPTWPVKHFSDGDSKRLHKGALVVGNVICYKNFKENKL